MPKYFRNQHQDSSNHHRNRKLSGQNQKPDNDVRFFLRYLVDYFRSTYMEAKHSVAISISSLVALHVIQSCSSSLRLEWCGMPCLSAYLLLITPSKSTDHWRRISENQFSAKFRPRLRQTPDKSDPLDFRVIPDFDDFVWAGVTTTNA